MSPEFKQFISSSRRLLITAGWAPGCVLIVHEIVGRTSYRQALDFTMHFSGGAAIAFFLFYLLICFSQVLGTPSAFGRYVFAFCMACTVGVFWEFGELFSDIYFHTHIQHSIRETMSDLIADATGAITSLLLVLAIRHLTAKRDETRR